MSKNIDIRLDDLFGSASFGGSGSHLQSAARDVVENYGVWSGTVAGASTGAWIGEAIDPAGGVLLVALSEVS